MITIKTVEVLKLVEKIANDKNFLKKLWREFSEIPYSDRYAKSRALVPNWLNLYILINDDYSRYAEDSEHQQERLENMQTKAKENIMLLKALVYCKIMELDPKREEDGERILLHFLQSYEGEEKYTKTRKAYYVGMPLLTYKYGYDFRTAAPYWFVWFQGQEIVHRWPPFGSSSGWLHSDAQRARFVLAEHLEELCKKGEKLDTCLETKQFREEIIKRWQNYPFPDMTKKGKFVRERIEEALFLLGQEELPFD